MIKIEDTTKQAYMHIADLKYATERAIRQAFYRFGKLLRQYASEQILKKNKTGIIYRIKRGKTKRRHQASAPGQFPANLSGELRRSLGFIVHGVDNLEFGYEAKHGKFLEDGTVKMKERPGLKMSIQNKGASGTECFEDEIRKSLNVS